MKNIALRIHPDDDVMVALKSLRRGLSISDGADSVTLKEHIPEKHKFALRYFNVGDPVHMYGTLVGRASRRIEKGGLLSTDNLVHATSGFQQKSSTFTWEAPDVSRWKDCHFMGYHRSDGKVGTANHWIVIPLVFCENRNIMVIKDALMDALGYAPSNRYRRYVDTLLNRLKAEEDPESLLEVQFVPQEERRTNRRIFPNVDGIKFLIHEGGCGCTRQDAQALCALLAGYINHPNVAGATVLSLGCQNAQIQILKDAVYSQNPGFDKPLYIFDQQTMGTEQKLISEAIRHTIMGLSVADQAERQPAPFSKLVIGMECGGSDGFSGISANPAMGHTADLLVGLGGSVILSEFPELCGVEQDLINRCVDRQIADKFISIQRAYAARAEADGSGFDMNPSPGNIRDGLITDAIKSAGAAKKGGSSPVTDVLDYTERVTRPGLNLLCTPGGDVESTTGLAGSGANLIIFSTGLGTPTGNAVAPVIKVSTNSRLAQRMPDVIDLDAGPIISGDATIEEIGAELFDYCIQVASGEATPKAVQLGQDDFIPWKRGISL